MTNTLRKTAIGNYWFLSTPEIPREVNVFIENGTELAVNSYIVADIAKTGSVWTVTPRAGMTKVNAVIAKTRKAAIIEFAAEHAYLIFAPVHSCARPFTPTACGTCGSINCRSRFDCSPGAPNDWQ